MTIITIHVPVKNSHTKHTHQSSRSNNTIDYTTHNKEILDKEITIDVKNCNYNCQCEVNEYEQNTNDLLGTTDIECIKKIILSEQHNSDKIEHLLSVVKSTKIYELIKNLENNETDDDKIYNIEKIFDFGIDIDTNINNKCPYISKFNPIANVNVDDDGIVIYEALLHTNKSNINDRICITTTYNYDGLSCGCQPNTIEHTLPIEMTLMQPIHNEAIYEKFDHYMTFQKTNWRSEYKLQGHYNIY